jgi:iron(III) transport system permease protein
LAKRLTLTAAGVLLFVIGMLPVAAMVAKSFHVGGTLSLGAYRVLWANGHLAVLMGHSLLLSFYVTVAAVAVGVPLGTVLGKTDLPLRRAFIMLFAVPLMIPPYVLALAWFAVLRAGGWIGGSGTPGAASSVSEVYFGLHGCAGVLLTAFMPIVMCLTIAYLGAVNPRLEDAGRLVSGWGGVLMRITLPMIAPAILLGAVLVFLLTLGEIGVPSYLRYPVYPVEILTQFAAFYDFSAATAAAVPLLAVTLVIVGAEYWLLPERGRELRISAIAATPRQIELKRWRLPLFAIVVVWMLITVAVPMAVLVAQSLSLDAYAMAFERAGDSILRSLFFAAIGATALSVLAFFCGYLIHHRALPLWRGVDALALLLITLPGTVIGIGLISLWNNSITDFIYRSPAIIILGYLAQYAVLPTRMVSAMLARVPANMEFAAQLAGAGWFTTLRSIIVPMAKRGLIAAWIAGYVFCLRDLGISIVVYPPASDPLPVRILTLMANGAPSLIAALCVILIVVTLLPLAPAVVWQWRDERDR